MPALFPKGEFEWRRSVEAYLAQFHTDIQRLWGRQPQPGQSAPPGALMPIDPTSPPAPDEIDWPPDEGGGGTSARLVRLTAHVDGLAGTSVQPCAEADWSEDSGADPITAVNGYPHWLLNQTGGRRAIIQQIGETWWITWADGAGNLLGVTAADAVKGANVNVTLYSGTPGSETTTGITVSAHLRYGDVTGSKKCRVSWDDSGYYVTLAECS